MRLDSLGDRSARNVKTNREDRWRRGLLLVCSGLILCSPPEAGAATFGELYTVSVEPDPEARDRRSDAIRRGMELLLTRVTGRQQAAAYPEMRELIENAEQYLDSYGQPASDEIRVGFIRSEVNQALTRLNMPIWGDERPSILLWIASDFGDGQRAELKAFEATNEGRAGTVAGVASNPLSDEAAAFFENITAEVLTAADERGLPLVLPVLDAEDRRQVRFADVWGGFDRFVAGAAERYAVDAVLIGRVSMTDLGLEVNWTVLHGERRQTWTVPRARTGIDWLADEFALEYRTIGDARLTWITVREIQRWPDFRVVEYLESVSIVESVDIESMTGSDLVLRVVARGDDSQLERHLMLDGELSAVESTDGLVFVPSWFVSTESFDRP